MSLRPKIFVSRSLVIFGNSKPRRSTVLRWWTPSCSRIISMYIHFFSACTRSKLSDRGTLSAAPTGTCRTSGCRWRLSVTSFPVDGGCGAAYTVYWLADVLSWVTLARDSGWTCTEVELTWALSNPLICKVSRVKQLQGECLGDP